MPTPCAPQARSRHEFRLKIPSSATAPVIAPFLCEIRSRALFGAANHFMLDCSGIAELSNPVLGLIAELRSELREKGADLVLVNCEPELKDAVTGGPHADLLGAASTGHAAHALRGPHEAFLRSFRAGA
jgi:hypothetical protein